VGKLGLRIAVACGLAVLMVLTLGARVAGAAPTSPPPVKAAPVAPPTAVPDAVPTSLRSRRRYRAGQRRHRALEGVRASWAVGVSTERQEAALAHLQEGNSLLKESLFLEAAKVYRKALSEWDHPGIHYNLALALLNLDQPVEVYQNLVAAVKFAPIRSTPRSSSTPRATCA